jgi:hypothetical protein
MIQLMTKTLFTSFLLAAMTISVRFEAKAQNIPIPNKEFSIFTDDSISIKQESQKKLDVLVLRSKKFKGKVRMDVSSSLPKGVEITFDPPQGTFDYCVATINVNASVRPGTYLVVISGTIQSKSIGRMLKLTVADKI